MKNFAKSARLCYNINTPTVILFAKKSEYLYSINSPLSGANIVTVGAKTVFPKRAF